MENYHRQRTISDPLNTSMLQHEIEDAIYNDVEMGNY